MNAYARQLSAAQRQHESESAYDETAEARTERREEIRMDLERQWLANPDRLTDAASEVIGWGYDNMHRDVAAAMQGHPDDQDARDLRFMRELRAKVAARIGADAVTEAAAIEEREWQAGEEGREESRRAAA